MHEAQWGDGVCRDNARKVAACNGWFSQSDKGASFVMVEYVCSDATCASCRMDL
jgi:hypothetical protein